MRATMGMIGAITGRLARLGLQMLAVAIASVVSLLVTDRAADAGQSIMPPSDKCAAHLIGLAANDFLRKGAHIVVECGREQQQLQLRVLAPDPANHAR